LYLRLLLDIAGGTQQFIV